MIHRIGIQILSFNKPKYLKQTLDSLITKIGTTDKILVFEQSTDEKLKSECIDICKTYSDLHLIISKENLGQRGATNKVIESGFYNDCQYVMLSDHDNLFHEKLDIYVDKLNDSPNIWITTGLVN